MGIKACKSNYPSTTSCVAHYAKDDGTMCEQSKTFGFEIFDEFNRAYENRLDYFDKMIGSDCAELKYPIYKNWVSDLIVQNKKFIQLLDELEQDARRSVDHNLRLKTSDKSTFVGVDRNHNLEDDLKNLLELIHRALETNKWNVDGLQFQTITIEDIFGNFLKMNESGSVLRISTVTTDPEADVCITQLKVEMDRLRHELTLKDNVIEGYKGQIKHTHFDCDPNCEGDF